MNECRFRQYKTLFSPAIKFAGQRNSSRRLAAQGCGTPPASRDLRYSVSKCNRCQVPRCNRHRTRPGIPPEKSEEFFPATYLEGSNPNPKSGNLPMFGIFRDWTWHRGHDRAGVKPVDQYPGQIPSHSPLFSVDMRTSHPSLL